MLTLHKTDINQVRYNIFSNVVSQVRTKIYGQIVWNQVRHQVDIQIRDKVDIQVYWQVWRQIYINTNAKIES